MVVSIVEQTELGTLDVQAVQAIATRFDDTLYSSDFDQDKFVAIFHVNGDFLLYRAALLGVWRNWFFVFSQSHYPCVFHEDEASCYQFDFGLESLEINELEQYLVGCKPEFIELPDDPSEGAWGELSELDEETVNANQDLDFTSCLASDDTELELSEDDVISLAPTIYRAIDGDKCIY